MSSNAAWGIVVMLGMIAVAQCSMLGAQTGRGSPAVQCECRCP